ncbi:MAG: hypothetical protein SYC29_15210 [Planctomycetota bacterium]|nr:hypothetical protein [Planctomycetota bacterium]
MSTGGWQRWMDGFAAAGLTTALLVMAGCGTTRPRAVEPRPVSLAAFVQPEGAEAEEAAPAKEPSAVDLPADGQRPLPAGFGQSSPIPTEEESEIRRAARPLEVGERVLVDRMVGQVNGKPIFADEFFLPIEDQLRALAAQSTRRQFAQEAYGIVRKELEARVLNALYLAEAEAALTPEQQIGLRHWLKDLTEGVVAEEGGSEAEMRQSLRKEGTTLEARVEGIRDLELIKKLLRERIEPRVIVSWRDVQRAYERNYDMFNPPAKATIARIRLSTERDAELIEEVKRRLAAGEDFLEVAASLDQPDDGIWKTFDLWADGLRELQLADETAQREVDRMREVGDTAGPLTLGGLTLWLHVAEIDRPPGRSLYDPDVQRLLIDNLRNARRGEERDRYVKSLLERGIYDELDEMHEQLLIIAMRRYGP